MTRGEILAACLELPLTHPERALLRSICAAEQADNLQHLGELIGPQGEPAVTALFERCKVLLHAHFSQL